MLRSVRALTLALFALLATACSERATSTPMEALLASVAETRQAGTSRLAVVVEVEQPAVRLRGNGVFDHVSRRGRIAMDVASSGVGGTSVIVLIGDVSYVQVEPAAASRLGGKSWIKIDLPAPGRAHGIDLSRLDPLHANDPAGALDFLLGASQDTREVGQEKVRGTVTTHYAATLDLDKAAQSLPPDLGDDIERTAELLGTKQLPVDVWIDDEGRLRKIIYSVDTSKVKGAAAAAGKATTTLELFDFGVEVRVQEPPADQVTDLSQLLSAAGR